MNQPNRSLPLVVLAISLSPLFGCSDAAEGELASSEVEQELTVNSGSVMSIVGVQSGKCLGIKGSSTSSGALVQIQGCSGSTFQQWRAVRDSAGYYQLVNLGSGMCLDVPGASKLEGTNIQQWGCAGSDNQKWNLSDQGAGSFAILSKSSGLALDVYNFSTENGARVVQWTYLGGANQKWVLNGASFGSGSTANTVSGFASTSSNGLSTTTGGGSASPISVTTCSALKSYLEDGSARVLQIPSGTTLDCRTNPTTVQACELKCSSSSSQLFWRLPVTGQTCTTLADFNGDGTLDVPAGTLVNKQRTDFTINVNSNKTLLGLGSGGTLLGVSLNISNKSNIILRNVALRQINPNLIEAGDGLTINTSHHVWVDHCSFSMISDGYADIRYGSSAVTLSNNHIDGRNSYVCGGQHNFVSLVSDSEVTYHNNYFDHVGGRNPKVTGASKVHLYSNYYDGVSYFCASSGTGAQLLVESNYYYNSRYPHWNEGGILEASGNVYAGTTSTSGRDTSGDAFTPPYAYTKATASTLNSSVPAGAGIGKL